MLGNKHALGNLPNKTSFKKGQISINKGRKGMHISPKTEFKKGMKPWNWKGGVTSEQRKLRSSLEYKAWRMDVYKRDWFTCQMPGCGFKGRGIEAHHIKKVKDFPELLLEIRNGITLCRDCHNKTRTREHKFESLFTQIVLSKNSFQTP
jgi:hypothetical protein